MITIFISIILFFFFTYLSINLTGYTISDRIGFIKVDITKPIHTNYPKNLDVYEGANYLGKTPVIYPLREGAHKITIKKFGFLDKTYNINIEAGKYTDIKAEIEINCKDSDKAIRPNDKGKVTSYRSTTGYSYSPSTFSDYCFDAQSVVEYYCGKQEVLSRTISCNKGCSAGKCL